MFVSSSSGLAVTLFPIGSSNLGSWLSEVVDVVRVFSHSRDALSNWVSPGAADVCPEALCEVPEEYGRIRHIVLEYVLADSWWLEVVIGISLAIHACSVLVLLGLLLPGPATKGSRRMSYRRLPYAVSCPEISCS